MIFLDGWHGNERPSSVFRLRSHCQSVLYIARGIQDDHNGSLRSLTETCRDTMADPARVRRESSESRRRQRLAHPDIRVGGVPNQ